MPQLSDPNFNGSVTYLCQHNSEGAMGVVINKPSDLILGEIFEQLEFPTSSKHSQQTVLIGGPVHNERGFILHTGIKDEWESTMEITEGVQLTTSKDILAAIAEDKGPEQFIVALGYAGWGAGQLEEEIGQNSWLTCTSSKDMLFGTPVDKYYDTALATLGLDQAKLVGQAGHA